tara:strand:- start:372 stop:596 length:225 start_codon:yes stop_codon:yes gene_type:complete
MIDAVVGAVIMVVATTSLVFAIEVAEKAFSQSGRYPLNSDERSVLESVNLSGNSADKFWQDNLNNAPQQVENDD